MNICILFYYILVLFSIIDGYTYGIWYMVCMVSSYSDPHSHDLENSQQLHWKFVSEILIKI